MRQPSSTIVTAIADPLGWKGKPTLSLYLDTGTVTWAWDDSSGVNFDIKKLYAGNGLDPTSVELDLYSAAAVIGSSTIEQAALGVAGVLRGRRLVLSLALTTTAGTESLVVFDGRVTQAKTTTLGVTIMATGAMSSADQRQGTMPVGLQCPWVLYSTDCGATPIMSTLTTSAGSTATALKVAAVGSATTGDQVTLATGETALVRSVNSTTKTITLDRPIAAPGSGVSVTLTAGCRKFLADCRDRHSNTIHFGGCPWRPVQSITAGS